MPAKILICIFLVSIAFSVYIARLEMFKRDSQAQISEAKDTANTCLREVTLQQEQIRQLQRQAIAPRKARVLQSREYNEHDNKIKELESKQETLQIHQHYLLDFIQEQGHSTTDLQEQLLQTSEHTSTQAAALQRKVGVFTRKITVAITNLRNELSQAREAAIVGVKAKITALEAQIQARLAEANIVVTRIKARIAKVERAEKVRRDNLTEAQKYVDFGELPDAITSRLNAEQKAQFARLGPFKFTDATKEDLNSRNWCTVRKSMTIFVGECKIGTTDVKEGRGVWYYGGRIHEGYFENDKLDGPMRLISKRGDYTVGIMKQGKSVSYTHYNKDGSIIRTYP